MDVCLSVRADGTDPVCGERPSTAGQHTNPFVIEDGPFKVLRDDDISLIAVNSGSSANPFVGRAESRTLGRKL
jgi:hypothetical protein